MSYSGSYGGDLSFDLPPGVEELISPTSVAPDISPTTGEQLHPNNLNINQGRWDHHIEICSFEGDCDPTSARCINNYMVALVSKEQPSAAPINVFYQDYKQFPAEGAGDILTLRATPKEGPYAPCPVGNDARQLPCAPPEMVYRGALVTSFVPPNQLNFYVDGVTIESVDEIDPNGGFKIKVGYDITWSDRFAVHPCKISLYPYGTGVPLSGKLVPSEDWWKSQPALGKNKDLSFKHAKNLRVHHTLPTSDEVGTPGPAVTQPCTVHTCPWPKQLFLRDHLVATVSVNAKWDLTQFPFDKQMLRMTLPLLDPDGFVGYDMNDTVLHTIVPLASELAGKFDDFYDQGDWKVYDASIRFDDGAGALVFEIKVRRDASSSLFKVLIPIIANAALLIMTVRLGIEERLLVVGLSFVTAGTFLDPDFLGLPQNVSGVPFVQSLSILHMVVAIFMLGFTINIFANDWMNEPRMEEGTDNYDEAVQKIWEKHSETYTKWVKRLGLDAISEWPPKPDDPPASWITKAYRMVAGTRTKTGPSNGKPNTPSSSTQDVDVTLTPTLAENSKTEASKVLLSPSLIQEFSLVGDGTATNESTTAVSTANNGSESLSVPLLTGVAELLVAVPALIARQDPTKEPSGSDNAKYAVAEVYAPKYKAALDNRSYWQRQFEIAVPMLFLALWTLDLIIYFVVINGEPQ